MGSKLAAPCALEKFVKQVLTSFVQHYRIACAAVVGSCALEPVNYWCRVTPNHERFWDEVMKGDNLLLQRTFGCRLCHDEAAVWCPVFDNLSDLLGFLTALTGGETKGKTVQQMTKLIAGNQNHCFSYEVCL